MKRSVVIVAGGSGNRMGGDIPKQFFLLKEKPLLMHTIEKFVGISDQLIVVLNESWIDHWKKICATYGFNIDYQLTAGGVTRTESVNNGLKLCDPESIVAIHDAARPLISASLINKLYIEAEQKGNAVPAVTVRDSVRVVSKTGNIAADRSSLRIVQTPQCFIGKELLQCLKETAGKSFTDEASAMEHFGLKINLVEGENANIKITYPEDVLFAQAYLHSL